MVFRIRSSVSPRQHCNYRVRPKTPQPIKLLTFTLTTMVIGDNIEVGRWGNEAFLSLILRNLPLLETSTPEIPLFYPKNRLFSLLAKNVNPRKHWVCLTFV